MNANDPHPEDIEANLALAKKEKIQSELQWLADLCDYNDEFGVGRVSTDFIRARIAAIRGVL